MNIRLDVTLPKDEYTALMDALEYEIADIEQELETLEGDTQVTWTNELARVRRAYHALISAAREEVSTT